MSLEIQRYEKCNRNAISCWIWLYLEEIFIDAFQTRTYTTAAFEQQVETTYMPNMAIHSEKLTITIHTCLYSHSVKHVYVCLLCQLAQQSHSQTRNNARLFEVRTHVS